MNMQLVDLEQYLTRGSVGTSRILGMSYSSYATMKCGARSIPKYIKAHIDTLRRLDAGTLNEVVRERLGNGKT